MLSVHIYSYGASHKYRGISVTFTTVTTVQGSTTSMCGQTFTFSDLTPPFLFSEGSTTSWVLQNNWYNSHIVQRQRAPSAFIWSFVFVQLTNTRSMLTLFLLALFVTTKFLWDMTLSLDAGCYNMFTVQVAYSGFKVKIPQICCKIKPICEKMYLYRHQQWKLLILCVCFESRFNITQSNSRRRNSHSQLED